MAGAGSVEAARAMIVPLSASASAQAMELCLRVAVIDLHGRAGVGDAIREAGRGSNMNEVVPALMSTPVDEPKHMEVQL